MHGEWDSAEVWDLVDPHDRRCLLDPVGGVITSGDGARGRAFPAGAQISARYKQGGGALGNVAAGVLTTWLDNAHNRARVPGWTAELQLRRPDLRRPDSTRLDPGRAGLDRSGRERHHAAMRAVARTQQHEAGRTEPREKQR